jgi:hypothetical protein
VIRSFILLLLLPAIACGQTLTIGNRPTDMEVAEAKQTLSQVPSHSGTLTVGSQFTTSEVAKARETLAAMEPKKLAIKVGEFEVIEPGKSVASPLYWSVQDDTLIERVEVPKDQPFALWMQRRGDAGAKLHVFPAKPFAWVILIGKKQGSGIIEVIRNADDPKTQPPAPVDRIHAIVDGGIPKPVDPPVKPDDPKPDEPKPSVDAALVSELRALLVKDKAAAIGDQWKFAAIWAESFVDSSKLLKLNDPTVAPRNLADLYAKHKAAWMADDVPVLPFLSNTRIRVAALIEAALGKDALAPLDRVKASDVYLRIGNALKEALK